MTTIFLRIHESLAINWSLEIMTFYQLQMTELGNVFRQQKDICKTDKENTRIGPLFAIFLSYFYFIEHFDPFKSNEIFVMKQMFKSKIRVHICATTGKFFLSNKRW